MRLNSPIPRSFPAAAPRTLPYPAAVRRSLHPPLEPSHHRLPREHDPRPPPQRHLQPTRQVLARAVLDLAAARDGDRQHRRLPRRLALEHQRMPGRAAAHPPPRLPDRRGHAGERRREAQQAVLDAQHHRGRRGGQRAHRDAAAREGDAGVGVRETLGLAPPPVLGEGRPPVLLRVGGRAGEIDAPLPQARRARDARAEQVWVPVLRQAGDDLRGADAAEGRARPLPLVGEADVEPRVRVEVDVQRGCVGPQDAGGLDAERPGVGTRHRHERGAHEPLRMHREGDEGPGAGGVV
jgi:hypothetical protein